MKIVNASYNLQSDRMKALGHLCNATIVEFVPHEKSEEYLITKTDGSRYSLYINGNRIDGAYLSGVERLEDRR